MKEFEISEGGKEKPRLDLEKYRYLLNFLLIRATSKEIRTEDIERASLELVGVTDEGLVKMFNESQRGDWRNNPAKFHALMTAVKERRLLPKI